MHWEDYVCKHLKRLKDIQTDCYDIQQYKCKEFNCIFDEFHNKCENCKYDTSHVEEESD